MHDAMNAAHHHEHEHASQATRLLWALFLIAGFAILEFIAGWLSGSLALLADAGHMVTDATSLGLALAAMAISRRPSDAKRSYGYERMQVLAAFVNGLGLLLISTWIAIEALLRLLHPLSVHSMTMLVIAGAGLAVNLVAYAILGSGRHDSMNMRGAVLHVMSDLLGSFAAIAAALIIMGTGWTAADPLLSLIACVLILGTGVRITRQSAHVLLEGAPRGFDEATLRDELLERIPELTDVHHVHAWMMDTHRPLLTLHATINAEANPDTALRAIRAHLMERHRIAHATVQVEIDVCPDASRGGSRC